MVVATTKNVTISAAHLDERGHAHIEHVELAVAQPGARGDDVGDRDRAHRLAEHRAGVADRARERTGVAPDVTDLRRVVAAADHRGDPDRARDRHDEHAGREPPAGRRA